MKSASLAKTIQQCRGTFLRDPSFLNWLESLRWIVRHADNYLPFALFANNLSTGLIIEGEIMRKATSGEDLLLTSFSKGGFPDYIYPCLCLKCNVIDDYNDAFLGNFAAHLYQRRQYR